MRRNSLLIGLILTVLATSSCVVNTAERTGPTEDLKRTINLDKSESVRVRLKMGAGTLSLNGGSPNLMDADFKYNVPSWKPDVQYTTSGNQASLDVEQPSGSSSVLGNHVYDWDVRLNDEKPTDLDVEFGAGECNMNAGSLNLHNLDVNMGVGKLRLDLRGTPKAEYSARIRGGVGDATVYVPTNVGVVANASGGLGAIDAKGMQKRGDRYVNSAFDDNAKVSIRLDISGGIGAIHLISQ